MNVKLRVNVLHEVRSNNNIPGVLYGKGIDSASIEVNNNEFLKAYHQYGKNMTFEITVNKETHIVYIKDIQYSLSNSSILHFDLQKVHSDDTITSDINIIFSGKDDVSKSGLVLVPNLHQLKVEYTVGNGVSSISIDVSKMEENDILYVKDFLELEHIKVLNDPDEVVISLTKATIYVEKEDEEEEDEVVYADEEEDEE